jgi:virginiamycin B lyase
MRVLAAIATAGIALAGCGGRLSGSLPPAGTPPSSGKSGQSSLSIQIIVPAEASSNTARRPQYVSASTQSVTVRIDSGAAIAFNIGPASSGCTASTAGYNCDFTIAVDAGSHSVTIAAYDQENGAGSILSENTVAETILPGQTNALTISLNGVVASISLQVETSVVQIGIAATVPLSVNAYDADGRLIIGPGSYDPALTLYDSDTSGATRLSHSTISGPSTQESVTYSGAEVAGDSAVISASAGSVTTNAQQDAVLYVSHITEYGGFRGTNPYDIVTGPDNNIWFTGLLNIYVGKSDTSGNITSYDFTGQTTYSRAITDGPDGNMYITDYNYTVHRFTTSGTRTAFYDTCGPNMPGDTAGSDGNIWLTCSNGSLWKLVISNGSRTEYTQGLLANANPYRIRGAPDGNVWFTDLNGGVGFITPSGSITEYAVPAPSSPGDLCVGSDGNMWFTDAGTNSIGRISPSGSISEFTIPTANSNPFGITSGPDGALWFTESGGNKIGRITTSGSIREYSTGLSQQANLGYITAGPDNRLWFTEQATNKIGALAP